MKILKIFGIVAGIHLFALILIFANPGCSSTAKTAPSPGDTSSTASTTTSPIVAAPSSSSSTPTASSDAPSSSAITFNPDTPAAAAPATSDNGVRFTPTRPGTPVAGALLAEPVADVTPATSYTVKSGDNLWTIARRNNITLAQLTAANGLSTNASLRPGQKLIIPSKSASTASAPPANAGGAAARVTDPFASAVASGSGSDAVKHVVRSGETLGAIARKYGVRQGEIAVANNISDPGRIRPGMELVIPGWKSPGSKNGKASKSANGSTASPSSAPATFEPLPPPSNPSAPPPVPVIPVDESPAATAPKQP
jgi:LysM repeat protein